MPTTQELEFRPSVCTLDCPDTCSLSAGVDDGQLVKLRGSRANPFTAGAICEKVTRHYPRFVHGPARLRQPLARTGSKGSGSFAPISWEQALDRAYAGFSAAIERFGPQSVMPFNYAGPHGLLAGGSMDRRFFHRLGASLLDRGPLCGGVRGGAYESLFGNMPGMAPELAAESDLVAVWGNNVTVSNLHFARVVQAARKRGAKLVVVDPKRIRIAEQADLHLAIRPGTDVVLAFALAAELERRGAFDDAFIERRVSGFDAFMNQARGFSLDDGARICGVERAMLGQLVDLYAAAGTLATSIGNGIERGRSGGSALRAIMALNALLGQFGRPGAGVIAKSGLAVPKTMDRLQRPDLVPPGTRTINIVDVGRHLTDDDIEPPLRALLIYNHNPVATHPDQNRLRRGLAREDVFVVGCDVVMTDSLAYADVILPACSSFECDDLYPSYGHNYLQRAAPVIPRVGESLPNTEIFRRLAARFGFNEPMFHDSDVELMDAAIDADDPRLDGCRPSELPLDRALEICAPSGEPLLLGATVEPATDSGKVELFSDALEQRFGYGVPRYESLEPDGPLMLITPSSSQRTNATFGSDPASAGPEVLELHPDDAARHAVGEGDLARVWNRHGEVELRVQLSAAVRPGVAYSPKGTWLATSATGQTVNALLDAGPRTDIMDGACYNDTFVDVAPA